MSASSGPAAPVAEAKFANFLDEVKQIEERDSVWTAAKQLERLTKPGSSYLNLNPYEVLQITPDWEPSKIKKQYRKLSILVHPDKNRDQQELASKAFETVSSAKRMLDDEEKMTSVKAVIKEAKDKTDYLLAEKRKEAKKKQKNKKGTAWIDEDDPTKYADYLRKNTVLMFADIAKRKKELEAATQEDGTKDGKAKEEFLAKRKRKKEADDHWESGSANRLSSWQQFAGIGKKAKKAKKEKKEKKTKMMYRPPKPKVEGRPAGS